MAIKTPKWLPADAYPSSLGWITSKGEVLKKQRFTTEEITEWFLSGSDPIVSQPVVQMLTEAPSVQSELTPEVISHYYHSDEQSGEVVGEEDEDTF